MEKYIIVLVIFVGYGNCSKNYLGSFASRIPMKESNNYDYEKQKNINYNKENEDIESVDKYEYFRMGHKFTDKKDEMDFYNRRYNEDEIKRLDDLYGYTGPTGNDEPENLIRPCALQDWECIRKYFASNGGCKPAYGPIPDPLLFDTMVSFFPLVNVTVSYPFVMFRGLSSAKVRDFYVNRKSGNLVFAIDIQNFNLTAPRLYFRYRRTAKESIVLGGYGTDNFRSVTFTAVIPKIPHLRLELADIHADIQDSTPTFFISPDAFASTDPDVVTASADFFANVPRTSRERLLFQAQLITAIYIQKNICDFGLKLISA